MGENIEQSSNASAHASMLRRGAMSISRWTCRFMSGLWSAAWSVLVLLVLALTLVPELMMIRRRQSKTQAPGQNRSPYQRPIIDAKGRIFVINPDGSKFEADDPLMLVNVIKAWNNVALSSYVHERTKLPD